MAGTWDRDDNSTRRETYSDRIVKHRLRILGRVLIIAVILAVALGLIWYQQKTRIYTNYFVAETYTRETTGSAVTTNLADKILTYSNDGAFCSNTDGTSVWNITYEMQNPILSTSGSTAAIGNYDGTKIYVCNTEGALGEISTTMPIRDLAVSENGVVAAVLDDTDITWIYLYNASGETIAYFKTTMSQSGYPFSVSISPNSRLVAVSYLKADATDLTSGIAFYNFGDVGQNEVDNYMSGYDYEDSLVPLVRFLNSEQAFAVADSRLMFYFGAQKPVSKAEILLDSEIKSVYYSDSQVAVVTYDQTGEYTYLLRVYDASGSLKLSKGFDLDYKSILLTDEHIYIYSDAQVIIYNMMGTETYAGTMSQDISLIIPGKSVSKMTIVGTNAISRIELQ
ncbi:MAG: DUF5711 family protein [Lachnospiraceae bacterium]|nr:DUF5711 family protein [Lachnospiraceae bacterium]